jgi:Zn-dependent protease
MRRGFLIGRLFGTDVYCELSFFLLIALYFWSWGAAEGAIFSAAVILSILVHEFGHVLGVRRLLQAPAIVVLWALGGLCIYRATPRPGQQAVISLLGPATSFALGGLSVAVYLLLPEAPLPHRFLEVMIWINLVWGLVNLLPVVPLDGGQALRAGLRAGLGRHRGDRIMRWVSLLTAAGATVAAFSLGYRFAAILGVLLVLENIKPPGVAYD